MLNAVRAALTRSEDLSWVGDNFDPGDILGPTGVEAAGDAGALALPAYMRGVAIRAGLIASLPLRWEIDGQIQKVTPTILAQPDPTEPVSVTIKRLAASLATRGNAIAALGEYDDLGFPNALRIVHPSVVQAYRDGGQSGADGSPPGTLWYRIGPTEYRWDQVFHAKGLILPGSDMAVSPIEACRRSIKGAATLEEYGRRWFTRSAIPSAVVKIDRPRKDIDEADLRLLKAKWMGMLAGGREPVFVPGDITVDPIGISNEDSQFLETREFSITDVANIVGVPGYFLGARGSSRTYTNMQDERRALLDIYLRDDIEAIEDTFTRLLPAGKAKFDPTSFLRLDQKLTAETLNIEAQWLTVDEIRAIQGYPPLPNGAGAVLARSTPPEASTDPVANRQEVTS